MVITFIQDLKEPMGELMRIVSLQSNIYASPIACRGLVARRSAMQRFRNFVPISKEDLEEGTLLLGIPVNMASSLICFPAETFGNPSME